MRGLALEGHIGGMINPRAALMFDAWTVIHSIPNTDGETTNTIYAGAAQFWLSPIVWLKGGIGLGNTRISSNSVGTITDATALALMGAAGVEIVHSGPFALDLQGRIGHTFYSQRRRRADHRLRLHGRLQLVLTTGARSAASRSAREAASSWCSDHWPRARTRLCSPRPGNRRGSHPK